MDLLPEIILGLAVFIALPCMALFGGVYLHAWLTNEPRLGWSPPQGWLSKLTTWDLVLVLVGFAVGMYGLPG